MPVRCRAPRISRLSCLLGLALLPLGGRELPAQATIGTSASPASCTGDCDGDRIVTVDHLLVGVNLALGLITLDRCRSFDADGNGAVTIDELLQAVQAALLGCPTSTTSMIEIDSPRHGDFTLMQSVTVAGHVVTATIAPTLTINGLATQLQPDGTFSNELPLDSGLIFNPILAELTDPVNGADDRNRIVVVAGDSIAAGEEVKQGVALRLTDSGLDKLEASLPTLLDLDGDSLIAPGTVVVNNYCVLDSPFGCIERVDVVVTSASVQSVSVDLDAMDSYLAADVALANLVVSLEIRGRAIDCSGQAAVERVRIFGNYELAPPPFEVGSIDVNLTGDQVIEITGDNFEFTGGACDNNPIDDLIRAVAGDFRSRLRTALEDFLQDPDGAGPLDSPVAAAMQAGLSDLDFTAPLGESFGISFQTAYFDIDEDAGGVTFGSDALATAPPPAVAVFSASYAVEESFPILTSTTPAGDAAYDVGLCVSTSTLNQMIKAVLESGGLSLDLTKLDFGNGATPLTAATLSLIIPEARTLDPDLPLTLRFQPTVPPILTGAPGPAGELADLRIANLLVEVISDLPDAPITHLRAALDARAAFNLLFDERGRELRIGLTPPQGDDISVTVLDDRLGVDETRLQANLAGVVGQFTDLLSRALGGFGLPTLFGLQARGLEISRAGDFPCMFLVLDATDLPQRGPSASLSDAAVGRNLAAR